MAKGPKKRCTEHDNCSSDEFCLHIHHAAIGYCVLKIEETPDTKNMIPDEDVELSHDNPVALPWFDQELLFFLPIFLIYLISTSIFISDMSFHAVIWPIS